MDWITHCDYETRMCKVTNLIYISQCDKKRNETSESTHLHADKEMYGYWWGPVRQRCWTCWATLWRCKTAAGWAPSCWPEPLPSASLSPTPHCFSCTSQRKTTTSEQRCDQVNLTARVYARRSLCIQKHSQHEDISKTGNSSGCYHKMQRSSKYPFLASWVQKQQKKKKSHLVAMAAQQETGHALLIFLHLVRCFQGYKNHPKLSITYRTAHRPLHSAPPSHGPLWHTGHQTHTTGHWSHSDSKLCSVHLQGQKGENKETVIGIDQIEVNICSFSVEGE